MSDYCYIRRNYECLVSELQDLCKKAQRPEVTLVAVTKSGSDEEVCALAECGALNIGENRPQMLRARADMLKGLGHSPVLHEIGNLQKNKVKLIIEDVALIHSLDSESLAVEINRQAEKIGRRVPVLIEVNSGKEDNKGGIMPECVEDFFLKVRELPNIAVSGLMTMGPVCHDPEDIRIYFRETKALFDRIGKKYGYEGAGILSMGMSDSYSVAIEEGATLVRVGRRLFEKTKGEK